MTITQETVQQFEQLWPVILPGLEGPPPSQIARWLVRDGNGGLRRAMASLSERLERRRARGDTPMTSEHAHRWLSSFLNRRREMLWRAGQQRIAGAQQQQISERSPSL